MQSMRNAIEEQRFNAFAADFYARRRAPERARACVAVRHGSFVKGGTSGYEFDIVHAC
jgi:hypothetical protein